MPTFLCWIENVDEESDADEITCQSPDIAATALLNLMRSRGDLADLEDDDSFSVAVKNKATSDTTRWSVSASVSVTFGARLLNTPAPARKGP